MRASKAGKRINFAQFQDAVAQVSRLGLLLRSRRLQFHFRCLSCLEILHQGASLFLKVEGVQNGRSKRLCCGQRLWLSFLARLFHTSIQLKIASKMSNKA
jgi:hypothetical protein